MTDLFNRKATFVERYNKGLDTHRDDIGTLVDRINRHKLDLRGVKNKQSIDLYKKLDIYMTLLEDGRISYEQFEIEEEKIDIKFKNNKNIIKDHYSVQKLKQLQVLDDTTTRLRRKLQRKRGTPCGCTVGSCFCLA